MCDIGNEFVLKTVDIDGLKSLEVSFNHFLQIHVYPHQVGVDGAIFVTSKKTFFFVSVGV